LSQDDSTDSSARISRNVEQIETLLRKINEENKRTKEVLDSINRSKDIKETTTKVMLSKTSVISLEKNKLASKSIKHDKNTDEDHTDFGKAALEYMDPTLYYETSFEGKKIPIVMFNCTYLSRVLPLNSCNTTVGQKYRLSFKVSTVRKECIKKKHFILVNNWYLTVLHNLLEINSCPLM
jgi:hypothetical protein